MDLTNLLVLQKEYNLLEPNSTKGVSLKLNAELLQKGVIALIGANEFVALLAIASYMDDNGNCYPTQKQLSEILGWSLPTVNKTVNSLLEKEIDGMPLIKRELVEQVGTRFSSYYTILTDISKVEKEQPIPTLTAKDVLFLFANKYEEIFGESYVIQYGREGKLIKTKLLEKFTAEQIRQMINIGVGEYTKRWAKSQYPRPTVSMLCGWLGNSALALASEQQKEQEKIQARMVVEVDEDLDNLL